MANNKISALTSATTPLAGTEVLPIVQSGVTTKVAVSNLTAGLTGTASININGTVGATTPAAGAFTTVSATGGVYANGASANAGFPFAAQFVTGQNIFVGTPNTAGGVRLIAANNNISTGVNLELQGTAINIWAVASQVASFSSTGLAVTGAISATSTLSGGTSGTGYSFSGSAAAGSLTLDSSGNLLVGTTTAAGKLTVKASGTENVGNQIANFTSATSGDGVFFFLSNGTAHGNASLPTIAVNRNTSTARSINAEGTINASGADYAEYMTKASNFIVAKGDVVGIDAQGKLTNVFVNAVSFVVKSTDPSYVGGDSWGSVDAIGKRPDVDATQAEKDAFETVLEVARQRVDRIAFAGQVPVNVLGATAGQYIIPVNDNGTIKGVAKNEADLTMSDYIKSVGKVIAIEDDGRAKIIVKVC